MAGGGTGSGDEAYTPDGCKVLCASAWLATGTPPAATAAAAVWTSSAVTGTPVEIAGKI